MGYAPRSCLPNEDFGKRNSRSGVSRRCSFRGRENSILATNLRKVPRQDTPDLLFRFPKSSFGRHTVRNRNHLFNGAIAFNQPLERWESWDTRRVRLMHAMFADASSFNYPGQVRYRENLPVHPAECVVDGRNRTTVGRHTTTPLPGVKRIQIKSESFLS